MTVDKDKDQRHEIIIRAVEAVYASDVFKAYVDASNASTAAKEAAYTAKEATRAAWRAVKESIEWRILDASLRKKSNKRRLTE